MMDDETRWQDAAIPADGFVGPVQPNSDTHEPMDELETGIASIFAAMQAAEEDGHEADHDDSDEPAFEEAHTFQLLSELDRLWQRPSP